MVSLFEEIDGYSEGLFHSESSAAYEVMRSLFCHLCCSAACLGQRSRDQFFVLFPPAPFHPTHFFLSLPFSFLSLVFLFFYLSPNHARRCTSFLLSQFVCKNACIRHGYTTKDPFKQTENDKNETLWRLYYIQTLIQMSAFVCRLLRA